MFYSCSVHSQSLSTGLLSAALAGHKVRHIKEKVDMLGEQDQLVIQVLDRFCGNQETINYVMCINNPLEEESKNENDNKDVRATHGEDTQNYNKEVSMFVDVMTEAQSPPEAGADSSWSVLPPGVCSSMTEVLLVVLVTTRVHDSGVL